MTEKHEPTFAEAVSDPEDYELEPTLAEIVDPSVSDPLVDEIRAAESAHQTSLCVSSDDVDEDERAARDAALTEALDLRVEVNLAQHDDGPVRRVGSTDPRVRELEAPWTRKARRAAGSTR